MYDITTANAADFDFVASDGTPLTFSKITSKDNIQVAFPDDHDLADGQGNGLIFRRDGSHFKDTHDITVSATPKAVPAPAPVAATAPAPAPVAATAPAPANPLLALTDDQLDGTTVLIRGKAYTLTRDYDFDNIITLG